MYQVKERETERETSQVVKAQKLANISSTLPLLPSADNDALDTYFWVNNFDQVIQKVAGGDAVNNTHLRGFQEPNSNAKVNVTKISFTRTGKHSFKFGDKHWQLSKKVNLKIELLQIDTTNKQNFTRNTKLWRIYLASICIFILLSQRYGPSDYNSKNNRIVPNFAGN